MESDYLYPGLDVKGIHEDINPETRCTYPRGSHPGRNAITRVNEKSHFSAFVTGVTTFLLKIVPKELNFTF